MVLNLVGQGDRDLLDRVTLRLCQETVLLHSRDDEVPSCEGLVRIDRRVVSCWLVHHSHQGRSLFHRKVHRVLSEEGLGCSLDSIGVAAEEDLIHIHIHNLLLGVVALKLHCCDPFLQLYPHHLELRVHGLTRIKGLGKLLGDGTSTSLA